MKNSLWLRSFITIVLLVTLTACIQSPTTTQTTTQTTTPDSSQQTLHDALQTILETQNVPAVAGAIISKGQIIAADAVGVRKFDDPTPVTVDDQFIIGSCAKAITATMIAMLVEQGKLNWDTTMAEIFPELKYQILLKYRTVTVIQLLSHYAGIQGNTVADTPPGVPMDYWYHLTEPIMQQRYLYMKAFLCQADAAAVQALPAPGTKFLYSNVGYCIAAAVAERITHQSWEDLMTTMIFQPLGMTTSGFGLPGTGYEVDQPWQHGYSDPYSNDQLIVYPQEIIRNTYPEVENPAGFIYLSIKDWAKFAIQHLEGEKGGSTLLKPETFKILHTPPYGQKYGYALGWDTSYVTQYGNALDHTGATGTNFSLIWLLPDSDFGILLTTNTVSFDTSVKMYSSIVDLFSKFLPQQ